MSVLPCILIVSKEKEIEMAVSEQYIADLVAELNAQAIADEIERVERKKQFDLDVANGMYWMWNSGYIMAKMEGTSNQSGATNKNLKFHIFGKPLSNKLLPLFL
jgi:hypothetical protein